MTTPKRRYLKGEERRRVAVALKRRYESDPTATIRSLARETGRSQGAVKDLLWQVGTRMRPSATDRDDEA